LARIVGWLMSALVRERVKTGSRALLSDRPP
jgi:hypothetical protein